MKKNHMLLTIIAVATLLVAVVGATFAYFSVTGENDESITSVDIESESVGTVALTNPTSEMHISVTASDMSKLKGGTPFYSTIDENKNYEVSEVPETVALGTVTGGEDDTTYTCTFNLNVNVSGTMKDLLTEGDAKIVFSGALEEESDLSTVAGSRTVTMSKLSGTTTTEEVKAYVVFNNRADANGVEGSGNQNNLAGTNLIVTIQNSDFSCDTGESVVSEPTAGEYLLENPTAGLNTTAMEGGLYRYQGADTYTEVTGTNSENIKYNVNTLETNINENDITNVAETGVANYICFGTSSKEECIGNTDAYMYRIMGINENNQLKLIKKEALNERMQWYSNKITNIIWPSSNVYSSINGDSFLNNTTYIPNETWKSKIADTEWKYGDTDDGTGNLNYSASELYEIENGWIEKTEPTKIGILYAHDYYYGMSGGLNCYNGGSDYTTCKTSWIYLSNNDSVPTSTIGAEWTISRYGYYEGEYHIWRINHVGSTGRSYMNSSYYTRPVFFLNANVEFNGGTGTITDPFIIE